MCFINCKCLCQHERRILEKTQAGAGDDKLNKLETANTFQF